jgi:hypothetical protein
MVAAPSQTWEPVESNDDLGMLHLLTDGAIQIGDQRFGQEEPVRVHGTPWAVTKPAGLGAVLRVVRENGAVSAYRFVDGVWYQLHWWLHLGRRCRFGGLQLRGDGQVKLLGPLRADAAGIFPSIHRAIREEGKSERPGERVRVATGQGETATFAFLAGSWYELTGLLERTHAQQVRARYGGQTRLQFALAAALVIAIIWFAIENLQLNLTLLP